MAGPTGAAPGSPLGSLCPPLGVADQTPELVRGPAFHLEGDGRWDVQELPDLVLRGAEFSGEIEIDGYPAVVFEMPDGDQWAQKSPGTPSPKGDEGLDDVLARAAARVASAFFSDPFLDMPSRVAKKVDEGLARAAAGLLEELRASKDALDRAVRHGRRLRDDASTEWIADQLEAQQESLSGVASGIRDSLEYLTRSELP